MENYFKKDFTTWMDPADPADERVYYDYATVEETETYYAPDLVKGPIWTAYDDADKLKYLIMAARRIDDFTYMGEKASDTQLGQWPRKGIDGVAEDEIPACIKTANMLLAYTISVNPAASVTPNRRDKNIKMEKIGPLETEYFHPDSIDGTETTLAHMDAHAWRLISKYIVFPKASFGKSQTTQDSDFWDQDYGTTYPYGAGVGGGGPRYRGGV